jgi:hypothetical protein
VRVAEIDCIHCRSSFRGLYRLPVQFRSVAIAAGAPNFVALCERACPPRITSLGSPRTQRGEITSPSGRAPWGLDADHQLLFGTARVFC